MKWFHRRGSGHERLPALVLGQGITGLGTLRCLARAGVPVYLLTAEPGLIRWSRWYRPAPVRPGASLEPPALRELLEDRLELDQAVLFPCSDTWVRSVSLLPRELQRRFPSSTPVPEILSPFLDKRLLSNRLETLGIPHPRTVWLKNAADLDELDPQLLRDGFLKPRDTDAFLSRFQVKAFSFRTRAEAEERLGAMSDAGLQAVLQEYIPGPATAHVFVDGFMDRETRIRGLLVRRRLRMHPPDFGNSTLTETIPLHDAEPAVESLRFLLTEVGYRGIFSAEFKRDSRDGVFKLLEVNARPWWYVEFASRCGVDVCPMAYADAREQPVPKSDGYSLGRRCLHPQQDLAAYRWARERSDIDPWVWFRCWAGSLQPVVTSDDPLPGLIMAAALLQRKLRRD